MVEAEERRITFIWILHKIMEIIFSSANVHHWNITFKPSFHVITHDRHIAENTASDRQRLYGNTFQRSNDRRRSYGNTFQRSSTIIWKPFSAIERSSAIIWKHFSAIERSSAIIWKHFSAIERSSSIIWKHFSAIERSSAIIRKHFSAIERSSAIIWKHFSAIERSSAIIWNLGFSVVFVLILFYYCISFLPARVAANSIKRICASGWFALPVGLYKWK